jgi:hypothetical protein
MDGKNSRIVSRCSVTFDGTKWVTISRLGEVQYIAAVVEAVSLVVGIDAVATVAVVKEMMATGRAKKLVIVSSMSNLVVLIVVIIVVLIVVNVVLLIVNSSKRLLMRLNGRTLHWKDQ